MEIQIVESSFVFPSEETPKNNVWLSNLDLFYLPSVYTPTATIYQANGDPNFFSVEILKAALAKTLVHFYPLAGRLGVSEDGRLEIKCTGEGVLFVVARSASTVDALLSKFTPCTEIRDLLVPKSDSRSCVVIQVTFFRCGGVCLGMAASHVVMDGISALNFLNTWSDIARGEPRIVLSLDRTHLRARPQTAGNNPSKPRHQPSTTPAAAPASALVEISKDQLTSLKNGGGGGTRRVSSFEAIAAYAWRCTCKARKLEADQVTRLQVVVDVRNRVKPPLPSGYFGNAIVWTYVSAVAGDILSTPLPLIVRKINEAIARVDDEYVRSVIDALELKGDATEFFFSGEQITENDLLVNSWSNLPMSSADFGWGKPAFMGRAHLDFKGFSCIMRSAQGDGAMKLLVWLDEQNIQQFEKVFYEDLGGLMEA